jgi:hypothetical protein
MLVYQRVNPMVNQKFSDLFSDDEAFFFSRKGVSENVVSSPKP